MVRSSLLIFLVLPVICLSSDFRGFFSTGAGYDSNPLILNNPESSIIARNSFGIGYFPEKSDFLMSYSGNVTSFIDFPERNYHSHNFKFDYTFQPFKYPYFEIEAGTGARLRDNSIDADIYDYYEIKPKINFVLYSDFGIVNLSYMPALTKFSNFSELDNIQNEINLDIDKTIETETNIIFNVLYGFKNFYNAGDDMHSPPEPREKRRQFKRMTNNNQSRQQPHIVYLNTVTNVVDFDLSIYQSISDVIQIGIGANKNFHIGDEGFYFTSGNTDLYNEREFFNDIYNYEEQAFSLLASYEIINDIQFNLNYTYYERNFMYPLYLLDDKYSQDIERLDFGNQFDLRLVFTAFKNKSFFEKLKFQIKYDYFQNYSNAKEYKFDTYSLMLSTIMEL